QDKAFRGTPKTVQDRLALLEVGTRIHVQTAGGKARLVLEKGRLDLDAAMQSLELARRWEKEGLPGTVTLLHISGEMDYTLDHETMRWGRSLQPGDTVHLQADPPIKAVVKFVKPWRERTLLRLVVGGSDMADLTVGQRINLQMKTPSDAVRQ